MRRILGSFFWSWSLGSTWAPSPGHGLRIPLVGVGWRTVTTTVTRESLSLILGGGLGLRRRICSACLSSRAGGDPSTMGGLLARSSREHPLERTRRRGLLGFSSVASSSAISPIQQLQDRFARWETRIRYEEKTARLAELERSLSDPSVWNNPGVSTELSKEKALLEGELSEFQALREQFLAVSEIYEESRASEDSSSLQRELVSEIESIQARLHELELKTLLQDPTDQGGAFLNLQAGAGGVDAMDWTAMLLRMYLRWAQQRDYQVEVIEQSDGEVAGIKSACLQIEGPMAYGWLKGETGVHRLVRYSPFDANARRHTSFSAVSVLPMTASSDLFKVDLPAKDLRIETMRSSGAGGQHVNKTESAVRITHIPTGISASAHSRSQHQNKATAMEVLRSKLYQRELERQQAEKSDRRSSQGENAFGNQIRSYVLQPYQSVIDLRTRTESFRPEDVLDGDLDEFLLATLLHSSRS